MTTISRPIVTDLALVQAEADDHGNVTLAATSHARRLSPAEAREVATALLAAADEAEQYGAEQGIGERR